MIRKLKITDDLTQVAKILYQTDDFLFPFLFGKEEKAILRLTKLISLENNPFSYRFITIDIDKQIRGILLEEDDKTKLKPAKDFKKAFSFFPLMALAIKQLFLIPTLWHNLEGGRYIQALCVDKASRGQGIGSKLLNDAIKRAESDEISKLFLDVVIKNKAALKLYEKLGFAIVKKKRMWGLFPVTYWMKKDITTKK